MTLLETPFEIRVTATEGILLVSVYVPTCAKWQEVVTCMFTIASAFAAVEAIDEKHMQDLLWEKKRVSRHTNCFVLRRPFSMPDYPQRFDFALQSLSGGGPATSIH